MYSYTQNYRNIVRCKVLRRWLVNVIIFIFRHYETFYYSVLPSSIKSTLQKRFLERLKCKIHHGRRSKRYSERVGPIIRDAGRYPSIPLWCVVWLCSFQIFIIILLNIYTTQLQPSAEHDDALRSVYWQLARWFVCECTGHNLGQLCWMDTIMCDFVTCIIRVEVIICIDVEMMKKMCMRYAEKKKRLTKFYMERNRVILLFYYT